jgi:hypothetical protein
MVTAKKLTDMASITIVVSLLLVVIMSVNPPGHFHLSVYAEDDDGDSYSDGYDRGYEDGLNNPVNEEIRDGQSGHSKAYVDGYIEGYRDGCRSVEGNTEHVCENALDA